MESFNKQALGLLFLNIFLTMTALNQAGAQDLNSTSTLGDKIASISEAYVGAKYASSPLGEGRGFDPDPLIRFDQFDCTTFVETMGALAMASLPTADEALPILNKIRYNNGEISFLNRNHFTSLEWIAHNKEAGLLADRTRELFPQHFRIVKTQIDRTTWLKRNFDIEAEYPIQISYLDVLPLAILHQQPELLQKIPNGAVVNFVIEKSDLKEKIGTDLDVVHQGLAIWKNKKLYLRHAKGRSYGVIEESFLEYTKSRHFQGLYGISVTSFQDQ